MRPPSRFALNRRTDRGTVNPFDSHTFAIDSFSPDRKAVRGPRELPEDNALDYLAQRLADQHRGGLTPIYWRTRAGAILDGARGKPGAACLHRVARGRGIIVTAEPVDSAAVFEVRVFPLFETTAIPANYVPLLTIR